MQTLHIGLNGLPLIMTWLAHLNPTWEVQLAPFNWNPSAERP